MRRLSTVVLLLALGMSGCEGGEANHEVLGYVALFGGLAIIALVGLLLIAFFLASLSIASSALVIVNLRRPTLLSRAFGFGIAAVDVLLGTALVMGTIWMGGVHVSAWSGFTAAWPGLGGLWLVGLGLLTAATGMMSRPSNASVAP